MIKMFFLSLWMLIAGIKVYDIHATSAKTDKDKAKGN